MSVVTNWREGERAICSVGMKRPLGDSPDGGVEDRLGRGCASESVDVKLSITSAGMGSFGNAAKPVNLRYFSLHRC